MKMSLAKFAIIAALILTSTAYGQQLGLNFNYFGSGARAEGMGNAYLAISDDGSAATWNPAGLSVHEKTFMVFGYNGFFPRGDYSWYSDQGLLEVYDHTGDYGSLGALNLITPLRIKSHHFVASISYTRHFDVYYRFAEELYDFYPEIETQGEPNSFIEKYGGINSINLGIGTRIYKKLSFGVTGNIYYGNVITEENRVVGAQILENNNPIYYEDRINIIDSTKFTGFNASIGFLYAGDRLRAGLVVKTPFELRGESDSTLVSILSQNGVVIAQDVLPGSPFFTDTIYVDDMTSRLQMPFMTGLGLAYSLTDNWLISGDIEYKRFSNKKVKNLVSKVVTASGDINEEFTDDINIPNWNDVVQFRLGTEYRWNTKYGMVPIRFGFRNEAFPEGDISGYEIQYDEDAYKIFYILNFEENKTTGTSLALGTGIHWSQILLDVAYTYTTYDQQIYRFADELRSNGDWKNHHLNFTFTGYF